MDDYRHRLATGTVADDRQMTVGAFLTGVWLPTCERRCADGDLSPVTLSGYRSHVTAYLLPSLGSIRLRDLRRGHCEALWTELGSRQDPEVSRRAAGRGGRRVEQRRPRTVDSVRRTLRAALGVAQRRGLIVSNPAEGRMDSIGKLGRAEVAWWEPAELRQFLDVAGRDRWSALWTVAAFTGLRRGELCGLRWSDLDLMGVTPGVTVAQRVIAHPGEHSCPVCRDAHRGRLIRANAKTAAGLRWVPLTDESVRELVAHRAGQDAARIPWGDDYADHGLVFAQEDGSPLRPDDVTSRHAELIESAGLRPIRLHDMRHTACSLLLASGTPVEVVAMILGHASPSVTRGIYAHVLREPATAGMEAAVDLVRHASRAHSVHSIDGSDDRGFGVMG